MTDETENPVVDPTDSPAEQAPVLEGAIEAAADVSADSPEVEAPVLEDAIETAANAQPVPAADDSGDDDGGDDGIVDDDDPAPAPLAGRPADAAQLQRIVEGALMAAGKPLSVADLGELFESDYRPASEEFRAALAAIAEQSVGRGFELREVASGFRFQVVQEVAPWVSRLWEEKPQKYSRALLETLALIAYRQPITRGDIENIRGVAVASNIVKTLLERDWVRVVGHKDVPGRPAMYATTRRFLDYFNLKNLDDLPPLAELRDLDSLNAELALEGADTPPIEEGADTGITDSAGEVADSDDTVPATPASFAAIAADFAQRDGAIEAESGAVSDAEAEPDDAVSQGEAAGDPAIPASFAAIAADFAQREGAVEAEPCEMSAIVAEPEGSESQDAEAGTDDLISIVASMRARERTGADAALEAGVEADSPAGAAPESDDADPTRGA